MPSPCIRPNCKKAAHKDFCADHETLWKRSSKPKAASRREGNRLIVTCVDCGGILFELDFLRGKLEGKGRYTDRIEKRLTEEHAECPRRKHFGSGNLKQLRADAKKRAEEAQQQARRANGGRR